jgi:glutamate synthase (NADPH/NADH) large chain
VIEGCGSNGCEYMTGGTAVILGPVGENFAAGMTGGMAFVWDPAERLPQRINADSVIWQRIASRHWEELCRSLIAEHERETGSRHAQRLLAEWERERLAFWQIVPKEMVARLAHPLALAAE